MRLRHYTVFDNDDRYFDEGKNAAICKKVANKCYLPANRMLLRLIQQHEGRFRIAYSLTGVLLEQLERYSPGGPEHVPRPGEDRVRRVPGRDLLSQPELPLLPPGIRRAGQEAHGADPGACSARRRQVFRNTELIYNNDLGLLIEAMGCFDAIITEGADHILGYRSPNFVYRPKGCRRLKMLLKNYSLSDDIAFRFSNRQWAEWPLTAEKFARWVNAVNGSGHVVNLFMDYETLGEHQWEDTGHLRFHAASARRDPQAPRQQLQDAQRGGRLLRAASARSMSRT